MKTLITSIILLTSILAGCSEKHSEVESKQNTITQEATDWEVKINHTIFSSSDEKTNKSCEILNKEIEALVVSLQTTLKKDAAEMFTSLAPDIERPQWKYSLFLSDSVFMATDEFISVRLTTYTFTGGAHGMTQFHSFNYDVKNQRLLDTKEIINYNSQNSINELLKVNFENPEKCFDTPPALDKVSVINFTPSTACFTYEQYLLGAYACGVAEVNIPIEKLGDNFLLKVE